MTSDNRIPSVIRDSTRNMKTLNALDYLAFVDWLGSIEDNTQDWITVAQYQKEDDTSFYTYSCLASTADGVLERLLSTHTWEINQSGGSEDFGKPSFSIEENDLIYEPGWKTTIGEIEFRPLVFTRTFRGYVPDTFELSQSFLLFQDAFFVPEQNEYQRIDRNGDLHTVARTIQDDENHRIIQIESSHLRDYLAANSCFLVRYHDHRRWSREDISEQIKGQFLKLQKSDDNYSFELWLRTDCKWEEYESTSLLLGKDIVLPYPKPDKRHRYRITGEKESVYSDFIVSRDQTGKEVKVTCNEKKLSNYFIDRGTPHFLTPVYFSRDVLTKYYREPRRYRASDSYVACFNIWGLEFETNDENLIVAWLGDLGKIPSKEQMHWAQYNVSPKGSVSEYHFQRDIIGKITERKNDVIDTFHREFELVQKISNIKLGKPIFKYLSEGDKHLYQTLHLPHTQECQEFDEQIQTLAKIIVDSLDGGLLKELLGNSIGPDDKNKGSISLLERFLDQTGTNPNIKDQIITNLRIAQSLRSTAAAHRKGKKFEKELIKYELWNLSNEDKVAKVIQRVSQALNLIASVLSSWEGSFDELYRG